MNDIIIRMLGELPIETLGVTVLDHNGDYNIYLKRKTLADVAGEGEGGGTKKP